MGNIKVSSAALWTGRILKGLLCLFLLFDSLMKIIKHPESVEGTIEFGLTENSVQVLGFYLFTATVLYILAKSSIYGMLLLVAYLGGATAITFIDRPDTFWFLFPVSFAILLVIAEYLQSSKFRNFLSFKI